MYYCLTCNRYIGNGQVCMECKGKEFDKNGQKSTNDKERRRQSNEHGGLVKRNRVIGHVGTAEVEHGRNDR